MIAQQSDTANFRQNAGFFSWAAVVHHDDLDRDLGRSSGDGGEASDRVIGMSVGGDDDRHQRGTGARYLDLVRSDRADQTRQERGGGPCP